MECVNAYADEFVYVNKDEKQFLIHQSKRMLPRSLGRLDARTVDSRLIVIDAMQFNNCNSLLALLPVIRR